MKPSLYTSLVLSVFLIASCNSNENSHFVRFEGEAYGQRWAVKDLNPELPADWSDYGYLTFDMNASSAQRFNIDLYDAQGRRTLVLNPFQGAWVRASIPLIHFRERYTQGHDMASIWKTPLPGLTIGFTGNVGPIAQVDTIGVWMQRPANSPTLEIRNVRLTMAPEDSILGPTPLVDEFGQWIPASWHGKAGSVDDLRAAWEKEEGELQTGKFNVSRYGGYLDKKAEATGFFRVEEIDGRWWFVDPDGYLFFSKGSCVMRPGGSFARVEGREYLFEALVPDEITLSDERISRYDIYNRNLYRRYGSDWYEKWMDKTALRMDDWGLNTVGNWSDTSLGRTRQKPYVVNLSGWGIDARAMGMPDVYAPGYAEMVDAAAERQCAHLRDDPYLLGYFIGNEPPWPGREQELANVILRGDDTPMKAALEKHLAGGDSPERRKEFVYDTYLIFLSTVNEAIKRHDPNHLNLGFRFGGNPPDDIIRMADGFDVFSVNVYSHEIYPDLLERIDNLAGRPVIIGEFHFGVAERGLAPGLVQSKNQEERGVAYRYYVEQAAAHPSVIGTHWFQWWDQPPTGRFDGENYNIGFVDVTDRPYRELIDAARETHKRIPDIHSGRIPPVDRRALTH